MPNFKYKIGDMVMVARSVPISPGDDGCEHHIGKIGEIVNIWSGDKYPYRVLFRDDVDDVEQHCFNVRELDLYLTTPETVQDKIIKRIYKLYAKCPTTKHWQQERISA